MMIAVWVIILFLALASLDIVPLYHQKMWKEITVHTFFTVISLALALALILGIEVINPTDVIEAIFKPLSPLD